MYIYVLSISSSPTLNPYAPLPKPCQNLTLHRRATAMN